MPPSLPRLEASHFAYVGHFRLEQLLDDRTFNYGGHALSVSQDGALLYVAGLHPAAKIGLVRIPELGEVAQTIQPASTLVPTSTAQIIEPGSPEW